MADHPDTCGCGRCMLHGGDAPDPHPLCAITATGAWGIELLDALAPHLDRARASAPVRALGEAAVAFLLLDLYKTARFLWAADYREVLPYGRGLTLLVVRRDLASGVIAAACLGCASRFDHCCGRPGLVLAVLVDGHHQIGNVVDNRVESDDGIEAHRG